MNKWKNDIFNKWPIFFVRTPPPSYEKYQKVEKYQPFDFDESSKEIWFSMFYLIKYNLFNLNNEIYVEQ